MGALSMCFAYDTNVINHPSSLLCCRLKWSNRAPARPPQAGNANRPWSAWSWSRSWTSEPLAGPPYAFDARAHVHAAVVVHRADSASSSVLCFIRAMITATGMPVATPLLSGPVTSSKHFICLYSLSLYN